MDHNYKGFLQLKAGMQEMYNGGEERDEKGKQRYMCRMRREKTEQGEEGIREACWIELDVIAVSSCWQCRMATKPELSQG